jgi:dihydrofolate synthase/folylpolyglutamate synthase
VLEQEANERRAPLSFVEQPLNGYGIGLPGTHQKWNAALALECLHAAGLRLDFETVQFGLNSVRWPGRFEVVQRDGLTLVFDGAHNSDGAKSLAETWGERFGERKCSLVFSALATKNVKGIAESIEPLAGRIHVCPVDSPMAVEVSELAGAFEGASTEHGTVRDALNAAMEDGLPILVAGSLFLVGEAKALLLDAARMISDQ